MATVKIKDIKLGARFRQELGDITDLVASIESVGLLQPVVLDTDSRLIAGRRRIEAFKKLKRDSIPYVVARSVKEAEDYLQAERDENICRLDFTPSESAQLGMALERLESEKSKERQREGASRGGKAAHGIKVMENLQNLDEPVTRDKVGAAIGMSGPTYQRAKAVVLAAEEDPKTFGPIKDEMDRTGKISPAFNKVVEIKKGGTREESDPAPSNGRTPVGVLRANEAIDCLKRIPKNDAHRKRGFQIVSDYIRHNKE